MEEEKDFGLEGQGGGSYCNRCGNSITKRESAMCSFCQYVYCYKCTKLLEDGENTRRICLFCITKKVDSLETLKKRWKEIAVAILTAFSAFYFIVNKIAEKIQDVIVWS